MYDRRIRIPKPQTLTLYELVCIFLVVALLYLFRNKFYRGLGATAIGIIIGLCVLIFIKKASAFELSPVTKIFLVLQGYFLGRFFAEWNISGYYNCFQAVLLLFCFSILIQSSIRSSGYKYLLTKYTTLLYALSGLFLIASLLGQMRSVGTVISGTAMKVCFVLFAFSLLKNSNYLFLRCILFSVINFIWGERTASIIIMLIYVALVYLRSAKINRTKFYTLYWIVISPTLLFPYFYVQLSHSNIRPVLDKIAFEYTGGRFFSGRNVLWELIFSGIESNPLFGLGFGNTLFQDSNITISTHNVYMFLLEVGGILAVILFAVCMFAVWRSYYLTIEKESTKIVSAYFLGLLIFMDFEMFLLVNNFVVSLFWWLLLALPFAVGRADFSQGNLIKEINREVSE